MPLPLNTLILEAIAVAVDRWRTAELKPDEALEKIAEYLTLFQNVPHVQE